MPITINNPEVDKLARQFVEIACVGITDAIIITMREAIERRSRKERRSKRQRRDDKTGLRK